MKKLKCIIALLMIIMLFGSCSVKDGVQSVVGFGNDSPSDKVDENLNVTLSPVNENVCYESGEEVQSPLNKYSDVKLSYKVTNTAVYKTVEEAGIKAENIHLYDAFCDKNGKFDTTYKFILLTVDVYCGDKKDTHDNQCYITELDSIGYLNKDGIYEGVSSEMVYFKNGESSNDLGKSYYSYSIDKGESIQVQCGWFVPSSVSADKLYLSIGMMSMSTDGSVDDDAVYISLKGALK